MNVYARRTWQPTRQVACRSLGKTFAKMARIGEVRNVTLGRSGMSNLEKEVPLQSQIWLPALALRFCSRRATRHDRDAICDDIWV